MPVLAVNSEGVSFAMSFICGLSTIATLIACLPPPEAGDPPLFEPPPQPATTTPTTANSAHPRRRVPLMDPSPPPALDAEDRIPPHGNTYNVGLCWLSRPIGI